MCADGGLRLFFSNSAFAQADKSGMDIRIGVSVPYLMSPFIDSFAGPYTNDIFYGVGASLHLSFGYRWTYLGIGFEQQLGGLAALEDCQSSRFDTGGNDNNNDIRNDIKSDDGLFFGATYFKFKIYLPIYSSALITLSEGIGAAYGADMDKKKIFVSGHDAAFALKSEFGFTYFITQTYGVELSFEYAAFITSDDGNSTFSHSFTPTLAFAMAF